MKRKPQKAEKPGNTRNKTESDSTPPAPDRPEAAGNALAVEAEMIPPERGRGRPSKRTPELERQIADCLRLGMSYPQTCDACGVSQTQFRNWRKRYREFQDLIRQAEAEAVKLNLAVIQAAAASGKSWQAAAWFLERKHPEQWGKTETLSIEARKDAVKEAIRINAARSPEQLRELRLALQLEPDASPDIIEAALQHARAERIRRKQAEIFGVPYQPKTFDGIPKDQKPGLTEETLQQIDAILGISAEPTRAEKIAALIELQAKAREVAGKPPLSKAEAFEAAAHELDHDGGGTAAE
jgi:transposase-like protein